MLTHLNVSVDSRFPLPPLKYTIFVQLSSDPKLSVLDCTTCNEKQQAREQIAQYWQASASLMKPFCNRLPLV